VFFKNSVYNNKLIFFKNQKIDFDFLSYILLIKTFFLNKWFLDFLYNNYFGVFILKHSYETCYKIVDKGILEIFTINGLCFSLIKTSRQLIRRQGGFIYTNICLMLICLILFLIVGFFL